MHKKDSLSVRMLQIFGFGKSISWADAKFRRCASILLLLILISIVALFQLRSHEIKSLLDLLYEQRSNFIFFFILLFLLVLAFKFIFALFYNITSLKNTWGVLQELKYLSDWKRGWRIIFLVISISALLILFTSKGILEFFNVDLLGLNPKISAGVILITIILLLNSLKEIVSNIIEFRSIRQSDFPYRVTILPSSELEKLGPPLNDSENWEIKTKGRLTYNNELINRALFYSSITPAMGPFVRIEKTAFDYPDELKKYREIIFRAKRIPGALLWNEKKVRLSSDLNGKMLASLCNGQASIIDLQPTSYYDSLCTNEMMLYSIFPKDDPRDNKDLWKIYVKDHSSNNESPTLEHLSTSRLSNHIGINILAITRKGYLIVQKQGAGAIVNPGRLVPSSSGSLDWEDVDIVLSRSEAQKCRLVDVLLEGMIRELKEEDGFHESIVLAKWVIGYSRDLIRGGKPDFYGVCIVDNVKPSISGHESKLVDLHALYDLNIMGSTDDFRRSIESVKINIKGTMSQFLALNLESLISLPNHDLEKIIEVIHRKKIKQKRG